MTILLLVLGGLWLVSRGGIGLPGSAPQAGQPMQYLPWAATPPSSAGSSGTNQTSPIAALLGTFTRAFAAPAPYVPLSGAGGATTLPGLPSAPSGAASNTLLPAAPAAVPGYVPIEADLPNLGDPRYWWLTGAIDVAIMSDDVGAAMSNAATQGDLTPIYVEASMGMSVTP